MPGKIVVGTDFRAEADRAIDRAFCAAEEAVVAINCMGRHPR